MYRFLKQNDISDDAEVVFNVDENSSLDELLKKFKTFLIATGYDLDHVERFVAQKKNNNLQNYVKMEWEKNSNEE